MRQSHAEQSGRGHGRFTSSNFLVMSVCRQSSAGQAPEWGAATGIILTVAQCVTETSGSGMAKYLITGAAGFI